MNAARPLGIAVPDSVARDAANAQMVLDQTPAQILQNIGNGITATGTPDTGAAWATQWEQSDATGFARSCAAAHGASSP